MEGSLETDVELGEFLGRQQDGKASVGRRLSQIEVRFEGLNVDAERREGQRALPTLLNSTLNVTQELMGLLGLYPSKKQPVRILEHMEGRIRPSRMTLILGHPGSGKSTLLRAMAGKLNPSLKVGGKVTYNGQDLSQFVPQRTCAYVSQHDLHHAEMTVRETLNFSAQMLGANDAYELLRDVITTDKATKTTVKPEVATCEADKRKFVVEYVLKILGLQECADIILGDEMRRGISGGQKKRVTTGEMLVGLARCFFMDDISTGLDSSTTFEMVKFLRQMTHSMGLTMAISLLQLTPEVFDLFDDLILLCEGKIIYLGPCKNVLGFFESKGFKCPEKKNTTDFLQEVTSKVDQAQYWAGCQSTYEFISAKQFAEFFHSMSHSRFLDEELQKENGQSNRDISPTEKGYNISRWGHFKACFSRELLLIKRNSPVHIFKTIQIALLGFIVMTLFFRTEMKHQSVADGNRFLGVIFAAVVTVKFNGMTELAMTIKRLPTFYKQRELLFLPGWALLSSVVLLSIPLSFLETAIWTGLTYYVVGFAPSAIRFFQQFLALFCVHQMSMAIFRFIAVVGRTQVMSNILGTATLIAIYILGGFVISKDAIQPWLAWGHWISPMTYGQNAVAVNEFLDERWSMQFQYGHTTDTVGRTILRARGMFTEMHWFWICIGALLGFSLLFNIFSLFALEYLNAPVTQVNIHISEATTKVVNVEEQTLEETSHCGMVLPFKSLTLAFSHISYSVDMPKGMKKHGAREKRLPLLHDVTGAFRPGVLTALMGITGAGKTTLLDVLAGRKTGGYIEGNISISGYPKKQETFARVTGYCEQTDIHSPFLTVYESIQFSARLRLPANISTPTRNLFVDEVMDLVELKPLKNAMVGLSGTNGLSAEQRKRLTIAVELVSSPSIIFMDEPTTGLDARAAAIVMRTVRKTVDTGCSVVCTIHQPSIEIFEAFDELLLLKRGQLIYGGPMGPSSQNMVQYFEAIPGVPKLKDGQNPATWMLDVSSSSMELKLHVDYAKIFQSSDLYIKNLELVDELNKPQPNSEDLHFTSKNDQSTKAQCMACMWKQNMSYWKNPEQNVIRFIITIATSLLLGTVFWDIGSKITTEQDIFNILGVMYGSALFLGFVNASMVQPIVGMERVVFYRERASRMYSSMPYAFAQVIVEIPYITVQILIISAVTYTMIGFQFTIAKLLWFMFFTFMNLAYFTLFGMMTAALTPTQEIASIFSFFLFILWNLFSGFFIPRTMIPIWWRWYYWADPCAWTIFGLMISQLGDQRELINVPGKSDQSVKEFLQDYLGLQDKYFSLIVSLHLGVVALFLLVFIISIKRLNFQTR
uniref:ABC transporter G family member 39 n=1 Tax=Anthurium amnicola TaxID=1678845 RepID=A0A1D1YAF0_9ARAE